MSESPSAKKFLLIGIGLADSSLDGAVALLRQFKGSDGMAFILLCSEHEAGRIEGALAGTSPFSIQRAADGLPVQPELLYLAPSDKRVSVDQGRLKIGPSREEFESRLDTFFTSISAHHKSASIGILLSDDGSTGALGLEAIRAEGGITFVQASMASYVNAAGFSALDQADYVLEPEAIADELNRLAADADLLKYTSIEFAHTAESLVPDASRVSDEDEEAAGSILQLLRDRVGMDFSNYKDSTVQRRLERRRILNKIGSLKAYLKLLESDAKELDALYTDMLINVTSFFRSPETFESLRGHLAQTLRRRKSKDVFRVWVPGCSTGQEVYSLAMLLVELEDELKQGHMFQIFATDQDLPAVDRARAGVYPPLAMDGVSDERLQRFFNKTDAGYRVSKEMRDMVVFAQHNFVAAPPFSGMDLISCRNVLIYMDEALQRRAALIFHFALRSDGVLFLGNSETVGASADLFEATDKRHKIYTKKAVPTPTIPLKQAILPQSVRQAAALSERSSATIPLILRLQREADRLALLRYAPPAVLVDDEMQVLQFRGDTSFVLKPPIGTATMNLLKMARPGLVRPLKTAFQQARTEMRTVRVEGIPLSRGEGALTIHLEISPLHTIAEACFLITFEDSTMRSARPLYLEPFTDMGAAELARELVEAQDAAQAHLENYEAAIEELQASNEEVKAAYEELQSTNEELESTNEELTTVNEELASRNLELGRLINDLNNLHLNIDTGIMLLGRNMSIRSFTPLMKRIFNLQDSDVGSTLNRLRYPVQSEELEDAILKVMESQEGREFEFQDHEDTWYELRVRPYQTVDGNADGAVLVAVNVDKHLEAVRSSEIRHRAIFETSKDGILILDGITHLIIDANPASSELFGRTKEALVGKGLWEIGLHSDEAVSRAILEEGVSADNNHTRLVRENGSPLHVELTTTPYLEDNERKVIQCNVRDISARKAVEKVGAQLSAIVNSSMDAIISKDLRGIVQSWNHAAERLFGYSSDEMIGAPVTRLIPADRLNEEVEILAKIAGGETVNHYDTIRAAKDGRLIHVSLTISPLKDSRGRVIGASKIARDITDRIRAMEALKQSEARFRAIADAAPVLMWSADTSRACIYFNKAWLNYTGRALTQEIGAGWAEGVHPDDYDHCLSTFTTAFDERRTFDMEYRLRHHTGAYRWIMDRGAPRYSPEGDFEGYIGGCVDIHDQKMALDAIRTAKEVTDTANRAKDQFLAALSHELRTPLSPVLSIAMMRSEDSGLPGDVRDDFLMIRKNVQLEARLIDDLLDLTRITEGKLSLDLSVVDPVLLIQDTLTILQQDIETKNLHVRMTAQVGRLKVVADSVRLQQVFWNILKNAVKFSPVGSEITLDARAEGHEFQLSVSDTGIGITPDEMPTIFHAFAQGTEASAVKFGGLGLGLTISALIIKEHKGRIWAESNGRDKGAVFHIALALAGAATEPPPALLNESAKPESSGLRILLVEDHEDSRKSLARILSRRGHEVHAAGSIAEARQIANTEKLDVLISDLGLPDGSGHELMAEIRDDHHIPGIALSGYGMSGDIERSAVAGFEEHLTKPVDLALLEQALARIRGNVAAK